MANNLGTLLSNIADAIRNRNGSSDTYYPNQMANAILNIRTSDDCVYQSKTVSPTASQQTITADSGYDGLSSVVVRAVSNQNKSVTPTTSTQSVTADSGYNGLGTVTVNPIPSRYADVSGVTVTTGTLLSGTTAVNSSGQTITGTVVIQHYYTGSGAPASTLGVDGDIYLES